MNATNSIPPNSQNQELSQFVGSDRRADLDGMFDVAATIERLCTEGTIDLGPLHPTCHTKKDGAIQASENGASIAKEIAFPTFDLLTDDFLQTVVNHLSRTSGRSTALILTTKTGATIRSVHSGWDASDFRIHNRVLAKVAKESAWRKEPLFPAETLTRYRSQESKEPNPSNSNQSMETIETSACLNELSSAIGTPICSVPVALHHSSGVAVFLRDATVDGERRTEEVLAELCLLSLDKESLECLGRQLDTWLIVQRCTWFTRLIGLLELIRSRPRWWLIPIAIACLAVLAPIPYYPRRDCVFEPETKQFLSSPIQGRIASCEVRPGDRVEVGQLMARLDDDQLRRDLAAAQAEFDGAMKRRDSALATRATGNAALARIEMNQAKWKIESIEDQLRRLEIRATTTGIVVQGDWQRSVGMPLTLGQSLFEVAELKSMTAEVRLQSSDLAQINVGDEVCVRSDASGGATFRGKISRIEPRAAVIDDSAVFIADVVIHDPNLQLRPGMKATAQINAGWHTLGWYLFNRPYRWIANQWIW